MTTTELLAALAVSFAALDVLLGFLAWRSRQRWLGLARPAKVKRGKRNSIMLLGLGGTGKTTFVRNLFQNPRANPSMETEHYQLYSVAKYNDEYQDGHTLFVGDYRGQNLGQLVREFVKQQKRPFEAMSYGFINSLILVVDLFDPPKRVDDPPLEPRNEVDSSRVVLHGEQWNDTALDAVFGLLTSGSLKYVCVFVNKSDLLIGSNTAAVQEDVARRFDDLRSRLERRARRAGADFALVIGSAKEGTRINQVRDDLYANSVEGKS